MGQELVRHCEDVATSLDGAMASPLGSDLGDSVDPQNPSKMEDGEIPPIPEHEEGEHMDVSTEEAKGPENKGDSAQEFGGWQEMTGSDKKGFSPSQSQLGLSEGEDPDIPVETCQLSRHEKEMLKREHAQEFPHTALYISHKPDADDGASGWYQSEDCVDPNNITAVSKRMVLPTPDGALSGNGSEPLLGLSVSSKYRGQTLEHQIRWAWAAPDNEGRYPAISRQALKRRNNVQKDYIEDMKYTPGRPLAGFA